MNLQKSFQNWTYETDDQNILWLYIDRKDSQANALNREVMHEFDMILDEIAEQKEIKGLIIGSKKKSGFIPGADIQEFTKLTDEQQAYELIKKGQDIFSKLEYLKFPTCAMISGFCLGGGLELALGCDYRIAENNTKTRIGLPEVMLGIHPGWGGTVRLPRMIGSLKALPLILSGRMLVAKQAKKLGIIDDAVPLRQLKNAARYYINKKPKKRRAGLIETFIHTPVIKSLIAKKMRKEVKKKAKKDHYPAPYAVINNWVSQSPQSNKAYEIEALSASKLFVTDTSKNLVRVFFLQEQLKSLAKKSTFKPKHIHIIGAGTMGADIAAWCALKGFKVTLQDCVHESIARALKRAAELFKKKRLESFEQQAALDRLIPDLSGIGAPKADVIIEAVFEDLEVKQKIFQEIEANAKPDAVLATNTSSIPLDDINQVMNDPARLVGIHFFNPVPMMQLVEIVRGNKTSQDIVEHAMAFVSQLSKLPLPVKSHPGFLVNRVLMPYLMESVYLLEEGHAPEEIDYVAEKFGMPMGPIELADTVGLDVCLSVAKNLTASFGGDIPKQLSELVEKGFLGRKTDKGFYQYEKGKPLKRSLSELQLSENDIQARLIFSMLNESAACLREHVIDDPNLLDAGMIFGTGFAPFRGGPTHYVQSLVNGNLKETFDHLSETYGSRFTMDKGFDTMIKES